VRLNRIDKFLTKEGVCNLNGKAENGPSGAIENERKSSQRVKEHQQIYGKSSQK